MTADVFIQGFIMTKVWCAHCLWSNIKLMHTPTHTPTHIFKNPKLYQSIKDNLSTCSIKCSAVLSQTSQGCLFRFSRIPRMNHSKWKNNPYGKKCFCVKIDIVQTWKQHDVCGSFKIFQTVMVMKITICIQAVIRLFSGHSLNSNANSDGHL